MVATPHITSLVLVLLHCIFFFLLQQRKFQVKNYLRLTCEVETAPNTAPSASRLRLYGLSLVTQGFVLFCFFPLIK